ncbi:MAG: hypothetical protein E6J87_03045 [Deltaproteobacteria bacterium]|nr:MAG: hypothetical protein E6J87_03045 [Deltaproteobacteria bacterium]
MPRAVIAIASNPNGAGNESAYNEWYAKTHLGEIRSAPGVVAAHRYRLPDAQVTPADRPHRYLTLVELEVADLPAAVAGLLGRAAASPEAARLMELDPMPAITVWERLPD